MTDPRYPESLSPMRGQLAQPDHRFADLREDFLLSFQFNTARAYWGDLEHLNDWLHEYGKSFLGLTDKLLQRYLLIMMDNGYSRATVRRRLTCIRAFNAHLGQKGIQLTLDLDAAARELHRIDSGSDASSTSVIVVSDDPIFRSGVAAIASNVGLRDMQSVGTASVRQPQSLLRSDYLIVHIWPSAGGLDRIPVVSAIALSTDAPVATSVVAITSFKPSQFVLLRLSEAGCRYVIPYPEFRDRPVPILQSVRDGNISQDYALPTQWAIRQALGLRWNGTVEPFLEIARNAPDRLWTTHRPQAAHQIGRVAFRELQRAARDVAGLPEPAFARYANAMRRPPELPEWTRVRGFARDLWCLPGT